MARLVQFAVCLSACLCICAIPATAAAADQTTVNFETGPPLGTPVQDDYAATAFVTFPHDATSGFRPYRTDVGSRAHSGTVVGNVSGDLCVPEGGDPVGCETASGGTTGVLSRTATTVTLFAGELEDAGVPVTAQLIGHRTNGTDVTSANVPINANGINTQISVSSAAGDISSFTLSSNVSSLAFDDLTLTFPANSLPNIVPSTPNVVVPVLAGGTTPVQVSLNRVNNSNGPVRVSVAGLPKGVTAQAVTTSANTATLMLGGAPDAPSTDFRPVRAAITADPMHNANVAPGPRTIPLDVRVASPYDLQLADGTSANVALPACAPVDVPLQLPRDSSLNDTIHLSVDKLPAGVTANFLPSADIAPGTGSFTAARTLHLTRTAGGTLPADIVVKAVAPSATRTLTLHLTKAQATATVSPGLGLTARFASDEGTEITMTGNGFCPGTEVDVGNDLAGIVPALVDNHTLRFHVPRLATSGLLTIIPSNGDSSYVSDTPLIVDSFRNTDGFQFRNYSFDALSLSELTDAFGADDLFIQVNPCGLWGGHCDVNTGILDPIAALDWGVMNLALRNSGGHCFGISHAVEQVMLGKKSLRTFTTGDSIFSIAGPNGPDAFTGHYLDSQHALQLSDDFIHAWLFRDHSIQGQMDRLRTALARGDFPVISLMHGLDGHAVTAYHARFFSNGTADIDVYDSNRQFTPGENVDGSLHEANVDDSVIHVDITNGVWKFVMADGTTWSGGNGGTLFVVPQDTIPQNASLPGLSTIGDAIHSLHFVVYGSSDGAVKTVGSPSGASYLPAIDSHAVPGTAGTLVSTDAARPIVTDFVGRKRGTYSAVVIGNGFAGSVTGVTSAPGIHDQVSGTGDSITFNGGENRPLNVNLAEQPKHANAPAWSAQLHAAAASGGADTAALSPSGTLDYSHGGAATNVTFTLSSVTRDGAVDRFDSAPVAIGPGERLSVTPARGLGSARVVIRDRHGHLRREQMRNLAKGPAHVIVGGPVLRGRSRVAVAVRVSGLKANAVMGVVLRFLRGHRVAWRTSVSVKHARNGMRRFSIRLRRGLRGTYVAIADASVVASAGLSGAPAGIAVAGSRARVQLK